MDKTRGRFFRRREIRELFFCEGGEVTEEERMPATSLLFVPLAIMGHLLPRKIMRKILGAILFFDNLLGRTSLPSIFVAYSIGVSKDSPPSTKRTGAVQGD